MIIGWQRELTRLSGWLAIWFLIGLVSGRVLACLLVATATYLVWHLVHVYRLHRWLNEHESVNAPDGAGIWQDIYRDFYRIEKRNRKSKAHLENIVNQFQASTAALPDGAVVLDSGGRIVWFNEAAVTLLGFRSPRDLGQRVVNLVRHPDFTSYLNSGDYDSDVEVASPVSGGLRLSLRVIPYGNEQRLLIARDVSQQLRLEQMRRDFVANASHELRTPLTVLRGYLEMMAEESGRQPGLQAWHGPLGDMVRQASRMSNIIDDLLKLARIEAQSGHGRQEPVQVAAMLHKLVDEARALPNASHVIDLEAETGLDLQGQSGELESVFSNLIMNALQYTPADGEVRVRWWSDGAGAHFSVSDTGIGIEPRHIPRLTERFYRVDPARSSRSGGTGLGLAIVKHALEHHEGRLEIASEPNTGSTFICHFPANRVRRLNYPVIKLS